MQGKIYDRNMVSSDTAAYDSITWYEVTCDSFDVYGFSPEKDGILTRRIPLATARTINDGVLGMCGYGAGGRIRFSTNSPFVALRVEYGAGSVPTVCNHCFSYGFDLYRSAPDGREIFTAAYRPSPSMDYKTAEFTANTDSNGQTVCYTLNLPHFSEVKALQIGLEKGSMLGRGKAYRNDKAVVFYGSSITHGAAAGRPGNTYESFISQKYNLNYVNLGFAGNARGEATMAQYIADMNVSAFVCDYDHNAPNEEHLRKTHYPFYEIIRRKHPDIPYIMISKPDFFRKPEASAKRRSVILESYNRALAAGDKNVFFIDGETLFEGEFYESCTSDGVHPNDLGFYRMAGKIGSLLAQVLNIP